MQWKIYPFFQSRLLKLTELLKFQVIAFHDYFPVCYISVIFSGSYPEWGDSDLFAVLTLQVNFFSNLFLSSSVAVPSLKIKSNLKIYFKNQIDPSCFSDQFECLLLQFKWTHSKSEAEHLGVCTHLWQLFLSQLI